MNRRKIISTNPARNFEVLGEVLVSSEKEIREKVAKAQAAKEAWKKVVVTDPHDPTEIVCEVEPGVEQSVAVAVIDKTRLHYHKKLTEIYAVVKGELTMYIDGKKHIVKEGERIKMKPGTKHYALGNETWVNVYSKPGWTPEDHILVIEGEEVSRENYDRQS